MRRHGAGGGSGGRYRGRTKRESSSGGLSVGVHALSTRKEGSVVEYL